MNMPIKYFAAAAMLGAASVALRWGNPWTVILEITLVAVCFTALAWLETRRREVERRQWSNPLPESVRYRAVESRWKLCFVIVALIYGGFVARYGTVEGYFHRQQDAVIYAKLDGFVSTGQWQQAAEYLVECLRGPLPPPTRAALQLRLLDCWLRIADGADEAELMGLLSRAESLARQGIVDQALAVHLRRHVERVQVVRSQRVAHERAQVTADEALQAERTARLAAESLANEQAATLGNRSLDLEKEISRLKRDGELTHFATLLEWGGSLAADLPAQKGKYQEAIDFGRRFEFNISPVHERLALVESELQAREPRDLPPGASGRWWAISTDRLPPSIDAELSVFDAHGRPLERLAAKDFQVRFDGTAVRPAVGFVVPPQTHLRVVILLDCSGSAAGAPLAAAKAGIKQLLVQLQGRGEVKAIAFSGTVTPVSSWESDTQSIGSKISPLPASGATALHQALAAGIEALQGHSGPRLIVLFTDGKDTVPGIDPAAIVARLRNDEITVHAVGLHTAEFDRAALERFTDATGGTLVTADSAGQLGERFAELSYRLSAPRYRLVIPCDSIPGQLHIQIGKQNAVQLERFFHNQAAAR